MQNAKITIIQPFTAHYRKDFFQGISQYFHLNLISIDPPKDIDGFQKIIGFNEIQLKNYRLGSLVWFNPFHKQIRECTVLILTWQPKWLTIYFILFLKFLLKPKVMIHTHGTSVRHGFHPRSLRDQIKLFLFNRADHIIFYTENELKQLSPYLLKPKLFYVNNTLNVEEIQKIKFGIKESPSTLKNKYGITSSRVIIYCARFIKDRRPELLVELIEKMEHEDVSFIIIGSGQCKPDFSVYSSVFDFDALYDDKTKAELFYIADFSFQPAWSGLSVVESMANGVPYVTLKKSSNILQCVEYGYIKNGSNGFIAKNLSEVNHILLDTNNVKLSQLKLNCINYAKKELQLSSMIDRFSENITLINS